MDFSLLLSSYATVWSNPEVLLMTFIGALGGVLLGPPMNFVAECTTMSAPYSIGLTR